MRAARRQRRLRGPVLDWDEAPAHPHNAARGTYVEANGMVQPAPAPRFGRHALRVPPAPQPADADALLARWTQHPTQETVS